MPRHLRRAFLGTPRLLMSLVNLGEVYYRMDRVVGEAQAGGGCGGCETAD